MTKSILRNIVALFSKQPIKLYWWRYDGSGHGNFGDEITLLILQKLFHQKVIWSEPKNCDMIGAGSILQDVWREKGDNLPYVWGSGFIEADDLHVPADDFKFLGVRGTYTIGRIDKLSGNLFLGDPGLLASRLISQPVKQYDIGIVPHYVDMDSSALAELKRLLPEAKIINPTHSCLDVITEIAQCKSILSSSLHGMIVADSFLIPNCRLLLSNKVRGDDYKFRDYLSAFVDRKYLAYSVKDIKSSLSANGNINTLFSSSNLDRQELESIQAAITNAFPFAGRSLF